MADLTRPRSRAGKAKARPARKRSVKQRAFPLPSVVGSIFRTAREAQELSQQQVAALTEGRPGRVSRTMISAIERGSCLPGLEAMMSLSHVLNVEPMEILERVDLSLSRPVDAAGRTPDELLELGRELAWKSEYRKAVAVFDALALQLERDPPADLVEAGRLRARVEINRAVVLRRCRALKAAQAAAQRAVEMSAETPEMRAEAYSVLASVFSHGGLHVLAADASNRAVACVDSAAEKQQGQVWNQHGSVLKRAGDVERARRAYVRARELADRTHDARHRIKVEGNIGSCLEDLGRPKQARTNYLEAVRLARRHQDPASEAFWLVEVGRVDLLEGNDDEAERCAQEALRIARPREQLLTAFRAEWLLHQVVRTRNPKAPDRRRLAYLKKLWARLKEHRGWKPIQEFERAVIEPAKRKKGRSS